MTRKEIAEQANITRQHLDFILAGKRRPSPDVAAVLEAVTGINRVVWLYPDDHENPLAANKTGDQN